MTRERIPTDEPLPIKIARLETKMDTVIANTDAIQSAQISQGNSIAALPCQRHERRISEMLKAVNALRLNGSIEHTRLQTIWLVTKIVAGAMVSVAATIFGYLQTKGG